MEANASPYARREPDGTIWVDPGAPYLLVDETGIYLDASHSDVEQRDDGLYIWAAIVFGGFENARLYLQASTHGLSLSARTGAVLMDATPARTLTVRPSVLSLDLLAVEER